MLASRGDAPAMMPGMPELPSGQHQLNTSTENLVETADSSTQTSLAVAIPLYMYPAKGCWDPLYTVMSRYPSVEFHAIVNPANGPGGRVPDANYIREVARLNTYSNCIIFGYVHVSWGTRDLGLVTNDMTMWSQWAEYDQADLQVHGIFVDEAPSDGLKLSYMQRIYSHAKNSMDALVWTNPGVQIDNIFYEYADLVNAVENTCEAWRRSNGPTNAKSTAIIHGYTGTVAEVPQYVETLRTAGYRSILLTTGDSYTNFSHFLEQFVEQVASLKN